MLSVFDFLDVDGQFPNWANECVNNRRTLHEVIDIPQEKVLWLDSGGYELAHLGNKQWYDPRTVCQFQMVSGCDISCILDVPFDKRTRPEQAQKLLSTNIDFAKAAVQVASQKSSLMAVIHGIDTESMIDHAEKLIGIARPQVLAVPWRDIKPHGYVKAMATLKSLAEMSIGRCRLHLLAAGSVKQWPFIFACGVDSIDSTSWAHKILDPKSLSWKEPHSYARLDCTCSLCSRRQNRLISGDPSHDLNVYQHNLVVMHDQVQLISRALADGSISEFARKVNPKMHKELKALLFRGEGE